MLPSFHFAEHGYTDSDRQESFVALNMGTQRKGIFSSKVVPPPFFLFLLEVYGRPSDPGHLMPLRLKMASVVQLSVPLLSVLTDYSIEVEKEELSGKFYSRETKKLRAFSETSKGS